MSTKVLQLGKDWWKGERPAVKGDAPVRVRFKSVKDTEFWTPDQVAKHLGKCTEWVRRQIRAKKLRAQPVGRDYRIPVEAIDEMLEEMRRQGA
jgi:excisionase family DNA binding protein